MRRFTNRNTARTKALRNDPSAPEKLIWHHLRNRQLNGFKFSWQMPIGPYFADLLCHEAKLIIELDGDTHGMSIDYDANRDAHCRSLCFEILRFPNSDVMGNLDGVMSCIAATLARSPTPSPSRQREGDE